MLSKLDLKYLLENRIKEALWLRKYQLARSLFEAVGDDSLNPKELGGIRIAKQRVGSNQFRYIFMLRGKTYLVTIAEEKANVYFVTFHTKNQEESKNAIQRYGISSFDMIEDLFKIILRCIDEFLTIKKPNMIRMMPEKGVEFPLIFHQKIYKALKEYDLKFDKLYAVIRGDGIKDGSAFVLKRSSASDNLKNQSWKPNKEIGKLEIVV